MSKNLDDQNSGLQTVVRRVTEVERKTLEEAKKLIDSGVDTIMVNAKKGKITATSIDANGTVDTITRNFSNVCERMELSRVKTDDKQARNEEIVKLYNEGYSQRDIAQMVGLSQPMIHAILKDAGVLQ